MKIRKAIKRFFVKASIITIITGGFLIYNLNTVNNVRTLIPSFYAKEMCSCLFVVGQSEKFCHKYANEILTPDFVEIDRKKSEIRVRAYGKSAIGRFDSPGYGCRLLTDD